jgi:hypothetical protein
MLVRKLTQSFSLVSCRFEWFEITFCLEFCIFFLIQGDDEWKVMNEIFLNKDESIMEYEAIKLVNERANKNRPWTQ